MNSKQKRQYFIVTFLALIGSFWEMLGVAAAMPFVYCITEPETYETKWYAEMVEEYFHPKDQLETITILGIIIIVIYVAKNVYLMFSSYVQAWYSIHCLAPAGSFPSPAGSSPPDRGGYTC